MSHATMHALELASPRTGGLDKPLPVAKHHDGSLCVRGTEA